ncbi:TetR/AcrR family transcriptional regulator [Arthrobacter sp. DNA4]|uniref:SACE_7040 family transcriptional regulator n=1 Tax=Arthrobacter sp. DNA4 TaxID=2963432 RepID=UPI0020CBAA18|nr:TetR/AcrR family transcriptional regulator [Arthrobacter sp. DNA4]UTT70892.1 TetR/AcrR family transcriptional regulator [Arthrobacter sp. DNA4]
MSSNTAQPAPAAQAPTAQAPTPLTPTTQRGRAKENRRQALLTAAATLFAANGFNRVSLEDLGAAAGVSGPAVYRHFSGKQAVLADLLVTVSQELLDGGRQVVERTPDPQAALRQLVEFQVDFALGKPDVIRVQDRDFTNLSEQDQLAVRTLQRSYVEVWVDVLAKVHPGTDHAELRMRAHATFGLINSTPHSVRSHGRRMAAGVARPLLERMALAALTVPPA